MKTTTCKMDPCQSWSKPWNFLDSFFNEFNYLALVDQKITT
jgi:hypothetical protein